MCGIVGVIKRDLSLPDNVIQTLKHRGPDSDGIFQENNVFLGHTRLSILDLSERAAQPMLSTDGQYVIVFNGEIYNHIDIRRKLQRDFIFRSDSDTETVLNAFIKYGSECLNHFNGIFAFAIFNRTSKEIFISRDQLGVKPLYYYQDETQFIFSSEIKALNLFSIDRTINLHAISNYLSFLWSPGVDTPFEKVKKLLPGHYLVGDTLSRTFSGPKCYYEIPFKGIYSDKPELELVVELEELLLEAVERQMLSDVPVGFFLSGGLDSSLIVSMARKILPGKHLPCFTIGTSSADRTEGFTEDLIYARRVADFLNVELNVVDATIDIVRDFDRMIWHLDEPQADPAPLNVLNISKLASQNGVKVLLGGTAGDDLFSGYRRHRALRLEKYFNLISPSIGRSIKSLLNTIPVNYPTARRLRKLFSDIDKTSTERMLGYFLWLSEETKYKLLSENARNQICDYKSINSLSRLLENIPLEENSLNRMLYLEMKTFLVDHNLNYTDKMSMAVGVEARVPFLDLKVVDFATRIPPDLKMKKQETKYILKKVAEKYLPDYIIHRPKTGFGAPLRKWIVNDLDNMINDRLSRERIIARGIFNPDSVDRLIRENKQYKIDASYTVWALLAIESWMLQFYDQPRRININN